MSTNKTQNYALHAWEPEDHFLRQELNENFAAIDAQAVRVICGSYRGNSADGGQLIELGEQPRAVLVGSFGGFYGASSNSGGLVIRDMTSVNKELVITETGFQVKSSAIRLNTTGDIYFYIAFC